MTYWEIYKAIKLWQSIPNAVTRKGGLIKRTWLCWPSNTANNVHHKFTGRGTVKTKLVHREEIKLLQNWRESFHLYANLTFSREFFRRKDTADQDHTLLMLFVLILHRWFCKESVSHPNMMFPDRCSEGKQNHCRVSEESQNNCKTLIFSNTICSYKNMVWKGGNRHLAVSQ